MTDQTSLQVQEKKELSAKEEQTIPAKFFLPYTDIYETGDSLVVTMEMPGVEKEQIDVRLEKDVLLVEGRIDFSKYENLKPLYTEYNIGHYRRSFTISKEINREHISAKINDGVLTLELPKVKEAAARTIAVD